MTPADSGIATVRAPTHARASAGFGRHIDRHSGMDL